MDQELSGAIKAISSFLADQEHRIRGDGSNAFVGQSARVIADILADLQSLDSAKAALGILETFCSQAEVPVPVIAEPVPLVVEPELPQKQPTPAVVLSPKPVAIPKPELALPVIIRRANRASPSEKKKLEAGVKELGKAIEALEAPANPWTTRSLICWCRELLEESRRCDIDYPSLDTSFGDLERIHNDSTNESPFFGLNASRSLKPQVWAKLSRAYQIGGQVSSWVELYNEPLKDSEAELYRLATEASAWLFQLISLHVADAQDSVQRELHLRLDAIRPQAFAPSPISTVDINKALPKLESAANDFVTVRSRHIARGSKPQSQDVAFEALERILREPSVSEGADAEFAKIVTDCLQAGMPPSNKVLRHTLAPYRGLLAEAKSPELSKLLDWLTKDQLAMVSKRAEPVDDDLPVHDDHAQRVTELKAQVAGKRILFVGGSKGQYFRKVELEKLLDIKLDWPDAEDGTHIEKFMPYVDKCDVVVQLIRWSRHSYSLVLDEARKKDKPVVRFPGGLGINRMVYDLHDQLVVR